MGNNLTNHELFLIEELNIPEKLLPFFGTGTVEKIDGVSTRACVEGKKRIDTSTAVDNFRNRRFYE